MEHWSCREGNLLVSDTKMIAFTHLIKTVSEHYHLEHLPSLTTLILEFHCFIESPYSLAPPTYPFGTIGGSTSVWSFATAVLNSAKKPHPFERLEVVVKDPSTGSAFPSDEDTWSQLDRSLALSLCLKEFQALMFRLDLHGKGEEAEVVKGLKARFPIADVRGFIHFS